MNTLSYILSYIILGTSIALGDSQDHKTLLTREKVMNAQYGCNRGLGAFTLKDGHFIDPQSNAEIGVAAHQSEDGRNEPWIAFGDLNRDGLEDAGALLYCSLGGTGTWIFVYAILNEGGHSKCAASAQLGDRPKIHSLSIEDGIIHLDVSLHGEEDGMAQTTLRTRIEYRLEKEGLLESGLPERAKLYEMNLDVQEPLIGRGRGSEDVDALGHRHPSKTPGVRESGGLEEPRKQSKIDPILAVTDCKSLCERVIVEFCNVQVPTNGPKAHVDAMSALFRTAPCTPFPALEGCYKSMRREKTSCIWACRNLPGHREGVAQQLSQRCMPRYLDLR